MKLKYTLLVLLFFPFCSIAQYNWQALPNAPQSYRYDDVYFQTPQLGWAANPNYNYISPPQRGRIFRTQDGGNTWQLLKDSCVSFFRSVGFADSLTGWIGNLEPTIPSDTAVLNETTDGGITWHRANLPNPHPAGICGISVVNDSVVYAYGRYYAPAGYLKTTNKGATWTFKDMTAYTYGLVDGYFFNKDTGFLTGQGLDTKPAVLYTTDGGATWAQVYHSTRTQNEGGWKFSFPGGNIGYLSIQLYQDTTGANSTVFLKTNDRGLTWTEHPFINGYDEEGLGFINDSVGWIGGDNINPTYKTTDGGNTWNPDYGFGVLTPDYNNYNGHYLPGFAINRFRRFGDTLMYASGNTIYRLDTRNITGLQQAQSESTGIYNYPNPFNEFTTIRYNLPISSENVRLDIHGLMGGIAFSADLGPQGKGDHEYVFKRHLYAGFYEYTITSGNFRSTKQMLVIH